MRTVRVRATWVTTHDIEVPDDHPRIEDIETLIEIEDIDSGGADLQDWDIRDDGPKEER